MGDPGTVKQDADGSSGHGRRQASPEGTAR